MYKKYVVIIGLILLAFWLSGCASSSRLDMDYGTSYKLSKMNQIFNPDAEKNLKPVEGIDGHAAQAALDNYHRSFRGAAPGASGAPPSSFGTGTSGVGMGSSAKY